MSGLLRVDSSKVPCPPGETRRSADLASNAAPAFALLRGRHRKRGAVRDPDSALANWLPPRPEFQTLQARSDADAGLALHTQRLQGDGIVRTAQQHVAANADNSGGTGVDTYVIAGNVAAPGLWNRRKDDR